MFSKRNDMLSFIDKKYLETLPVNDNGIKIVNKNINNAKNKNENEYPIPNNQTTNKRYGLINCNELTDQFTSIFLGSPLAYLLLGVLSEKSLGISLTLVINNTIVEIIPNTYIIIEPKKAYSKKSRVSLQLET